MIVRKEPDGSLLLVPQTDHSRFVGQLAASWGNARFAPPEPWESIVRAATFHDFGWLRYETAPLLDEATGETPEFRQVPPTPAQLEGYEWCFDWLLAADPYAGLIVNMHRTGLWRNRYGTVAHPGSYNPRALPPALEPYVARNEARQQREAQAYDAARLRIDYRLMQVWDLLGLYFACQEPCADYIEPVPRGYDEAEGEGARLVLTPVTPRRIAIEPYPFGTRPLTAQLSCKRLPHATYPDLATFRRAYFQARTELREFELV